ncbi:hypothetical protein [Spirosoma koreense]
MSLVLLRYPWQLLLLLGLATVPGLAQRPAVATYRVKVVTTDGGRFNGLLSDVDASYLYLSEEGSGWHTDDGRIAVNTIRKVSLRRQKQTPALITGAILGGLAAGYLSNRSLLARQTRSPVTHALTLTFAIAGGAAIGLLAGAAAGRITHRVVRPTNQPDAGLNLVRQLEPFSERYQLEFINRLPKKP